MYLDAGGFWPYHMFKKFYHAIVFQFGMKIPAICTWHCTILQMLIS